MNKTNHRPYLMAKLAPYLTIVKEYSLKTIIIVSVLMLLLNLFAVINCFGQTIPLVYEVENTGATCTAPPLPAPGSIPSYVNLPDPFSWSNGSGRITSFDDWKCRRNEIKAEIERYEIGVKPGKPSNITATYSGTTLTVRVTENGQTLTLTSSFTVPSGAGPYPAVIGMNAATGQLPASLFSGCLQIPFNHDQVVTYANGSGSINANDPYFKLYPNTNIGKYSAWSWGISRLLDGLELVKSQIKIDMKHIAITGCSYAGKMALFGGALDERIALTIAQESGGGGVNSWRVSETIGNVEKIDNTNYSWFMPSMKTNFQGSNIGRLPHDHHELIAMIAPRAVLILGNPDFVWLGDESGYVSSRAAQEVWKTFGIPERFGFSFRGGHNHCSLPSASNSEVTAFVDKFLRNITTANTTIAVHSFASTNYVKWIDAWDGYVLPKVNSDKPVVSLTAPANNSTHAAGAAITISATASDPDGNVTKVEFYNGNTRLGESTSSPYTYSWTNVAEGTYSITAVATDNSGNSATSVAVSIVVGNPRKPLIANPEFDQGTTNWDIQNNSGATGTIAVVTNGNLSGTNALRICPSANSGTAEWHVQVRQNAPLVSGKNYRVSFMAKADGARAMTVSIQQEGTPYTTYFSQLVNLTAVEQSFTFDFNADVSDATSKLKFYVGGNATCVLIDKVFVEEGNFLLSAAITTATPATFCAGGSVVLNANTGTGFTYQWKRDGTTIATATTAAYTATQAGSYTVTITANSQTVTSPAVSIIVNAIPVAPMVTTPVTYCEGASASVLTAPGSGLKWYTVSTGGAASATAPIPSTASAGTVNHYVSQTVNGCESSRAIIAVTVKATPVAPVVITPVNYCQNSNAVALTADGTTLKWYNELNGGLASNTAPMPPTSSAGSTNFYVSQSIDGCESSRSQITVTVNPLPLAVITPGGPTSFVQGGSVTLNANNAAGLSYKWLNGSSQVGTGPLYVAEQSGTYTAEVTDANGCKMTSSSVIVSANANQPSVITMHSPTHDMQITNNKINFDISVQDPDGSITKVEYFIGGQLIWTSMNYPYVYEYFNPTTGIREVTVKVTDSNGGVTTSAPVTIIIDAPTGLFTGSYNTFTGVAPNPSSESFAITSPSAIRKLSIVTVYGEEVLTFEDIDSNQRIVAGSELPGGTYLLFIEYASGHIEAGKIVKIK